ncbi:hypothetical protein M758_12G115200 [Ceratodon purpureus]|nr:hypothetical protein M758_12G115200 [Ceratodon purpureus]
MQEVGKSESLEQYLPPLLLILLTQLQMGDSNECESNCRGRWLVYLRKMKEMAAEMRREWDARSRWCRKLREKCEELVLCLRSWR